LTNISIVSGSNKEFEFKVNNFNNELVMSRTKYNHHGSDYEFGSVRKCISDDKTSKIKMIFDQSIIEVFVENGRDVFTSLLFPSDENHYLKISLERETEVDINLQYLTI
ncbi:GH32 C-terminal domain-containing protein, partial [Vibrio makurazakiensis]|uniref:GH32 C-terminal domain-containing protein n=1 Tax=Vibrio makurazakiensis TaxID=2910250 RepID=UPI003D117959